MSGPLFRSLLDFVLPSKPWDLGGLADMVFLCRPWALALGTPVLVVAGIGHAVHGAVRKRARRVRSLSRGRRRRTGSASGNSSSSRLGRLETGDLPRMSREYVYFLQCLTLFLPEV